MAGPLPRAQQLPSSSAVFLRKKIRHMRQAVGSSGSVSSLDSISEDEESAYNEDFDKDLAYVFHVNPNAPLGNEAALQDLFMEDMYQ